MWALSLHRHAGAYLKRMPADRKAQVVTALKALCSSEHPARHPQVKAMHGQWAGLHRLRVGSFRVVFRIAVFEEGAGTVDVLEIGPRGDIYK